MASLRDFCVAIDALRESKPQGFSVYEIMELSGTSRSYHNTLMPVLNKRNLVERIPRTKPYLYIVPIDRQLTEICDAGELNGIFSERKYKIESKPKSEPVDETIEIDPLEILEQLSSDDFGSLVSTYVARKNQELEPLKQQCTDLQTRLSLATSSNDNEVTKLRHEIDSLRRDLKDEREKMIHLRNELANANNNLVKKEAPMRVVVVDRNKQANREHSVNSNHRAPIIVHRKPLTNHAPSTIYKKD